MYGYMDESIITIDGKKYCFLGFIVFSEKCLENIILNEFAKSRSTLKNRPEIKYIDPRDENLRDKVMEKIKEKAIYFDTTYLEITKDNNIHKVINTLIHTVLTKYSKTKFAKNNIKIEYDQVSYKIDEKSIYENFAFVKDFEMVSSIRHFGVQHADWIVGEAAQNFKTVQSQ